MNAFIFAIALAVLFVSGPVPVLSVVMKGLIELTEVVVFLVPLLPCVESTFLIVWPYTYCFMIEPSSLRKSGATGMVS